MGAAENQEVQIVDFSAIRSRIKKDLGLKPLDKFRVVGQETWVCICFVDHFFDRFGSEKMDLIESLIDKHLNYFLACPKSEFAKFNYVAKQYLKGKCYR
jgi:hypothetical protein